MSSSSSLKRPLEGSTPSKGNQFNGKENLINVSSSPHKQSRKLNMNEFNSNLDANLTKADEKTQISRECPYLDTIQRQRLDFDYEKQCSITLRTQHVYMCLVCGQVFQGRGKQTPAFTHSVQNSHHVFMNLHTARIYCIPDNYQVADSSLRDIQFALQPQFSNEDIEQIDNNTVLCNDVLGVPYLPGFIGLNNLKHTDYINVTLHALAHVLPLRNFFLRVENYRDCTSALVHKFGEQMRKIWSPRNFKSTVSPHEFIHTVISASEKKFTIHQQHDVLDFAMWLLNQLHTDLANKYPRVGGKKLKPPALATGGKSKSIIHEVFQGEVEIVIERTRMMLSIEDEMADMSGTNRTSSESSKSVQTNHGVPANAALSTTNFDIGTSSGSAAAGIASAGKQTSDISAGVGIDQHPELHGQEIKAGQTATVVQRVPCLFLSLDLPPAPLYRDESGGNVIPQIALYEILQKFDGEYVTETVKGDFRERRRYRITRWPPYLLMSVKRFQKNAWFMEKNPTIVKMPAKNLEMSPYTHPFSFEWKSDSLNRSEKNKKTKTGQIARPAWIHVPPPERVTSLSIAELKKHIAMAVPNAKTVLLGSTERKDLEEALLPICHRAWCTKYDLVANICHDTPPEQSGTDAAAGAAAMTAGGARNRPRAGVVKQQMDPLARGSWRVHVYNDALSKWYEIDDLHVTESHAQLIPLTETYIMVYRSQAWDPRRHDELKTLTRTISAGPQAVEAPNDTEIEMKENKKTN